MPRVRGKLFAAIPLAAILACAVAAAPVLAAGRPSPQAAQQQPESYTPAEATSAVNTKYPVTTNVGDIVAVDVSLDTQGGVTATHAVRSVPPLTAAAEGSLHDWKFRAARVNGTAQDSKMTAVFLFRPPVSVWQPAPFHPILQAEQSQGYVPPGIVYAQWSEYPVSSVDSGSVTVQVTVDPKGYVVGTKVLRGIPAFTRFALDAAQEWLFRPATLDGVPVQSKVAITFVFANPVANPYPSFAN